MQSLLLVERTIYSVTFQIIRKIYGPTHVDFNTNTLNEDSHISNPKEVIGSIKNDIFRMLSITT